MELTEKRSVSVGVWVGLFVLMNAVSPLARYAFRSMGAASPVLELLTLSFTYLSMLAAMAVAMHKAGIELVPDLRFFSGDVGKDFGIAAVLSLILGGIGAVMLHFGIQGHVGAGNGALLGKLAAGDGNGLSGALLLYGAFVLTGPVFEEIFCRRLLYVSLRHRYAVPRAVISSALIFALLHPEAIFFQFIVGAAYCLVYERYKRLDVLIFSHMMLNAGTVSWALYGS